MSRKPQRHPDILLKAIRQFIRHVKINHRYDVPYIAGYSEDGKTIYIDRDFPLVLISRGKRKNITKFLVLHEMLEKAISDFFSPLHYQYAHEIATIAEKEAVKKEGLNVKIYDKFVKKHGKVVMQKKVRRPPPDLDLKPYRDEKDTKNLYQLRTKQRKK